MQLKFFFLCQFPGEESCVALPGVAVESDLIVSPLTTSQVTVNSSVRASSDLAEVFDEMPKVEAKPQLADKPQEEEEEEEQEAPRATPEEEEDSGPVPIWKAAGVVAIVLFVLSLLGSVLVFEGEIHSSALNAFRSSPAVEGVFHNIYRPLRRGMLG